MKITIAWLDELNAALNNANNVDTSFNIEDILNPDFMSKHTQFSSIQEMFDKSGFAMAEQDDMQKTANPDFDHFVEKTTGFVCRNEMVSSAGKDFMKSRMITDI